MSGYRTQHPRTLGALIILSLMVAASRGTTAPGAGTTGGTGAAGTGRAVSRAPTHVVLPFSDLPCLKTVENLVENWGAALSWRSADFDRHVYRSPTAKTGVWLQIEKVGGNELRLTRLTRRSEVKTSVDLVTCKSQMNMGVFPTQAQQPANFDDQELSQIVQSQKPGLILVWSPHMPYSKQAIVNAQTATKKMNRDLILVLDQNADFAEAKKFGESLKLPQESYLKNDSLELSLRGLELHFPSVVAYANGKVSDKILPGLAEPALYEKYLRENTPK